MWQIKSADGKTIRAIVEKVEYSDEWMGESSVSVDVNSALVGGFQIGDYIEYRGERFELISEPTENKSGAIRTSGAAFTYKTMKFYGLRDELTRCEFYDVVLNDNDVHYTKLPTFDFYAETIQAVANRIQANLDRVYTGERAWTVVCNPEYAEKENINVSISQQNVWDVLTTVVNDFGCTFTIVGRTLTIGVAGISLPLVFKHGKGEGLYEIERTADTDQKVVTRVRAFGSEQNLPERYYSRIGCKVAVPIKTIAGYYEPTNGDVSLNQFKFELESYGKLTDGTTVTITLREKIYEATYHYDTLRVPERWLQISGITSAEMYAVQVGDVVQFGSGVSLDDFATKYLDTSGQVLPNNYAVNCLMLPGFPDKSLRSLETDENVQPLRSDNAQDPYVDSANIDAIGIREGTIFFDGSDEDLPEIMPSMENMTAELLKASGGHTVSSGELDVLRGATAITDNGTSVKDGEELKPQSETFEISLKDIGFNLWDYRTSEGGQSISFKSGKLGGREFEITKCEKSDTEGYNLTCKRVYDDAIQLWFPYSDYNAAAGDKFVLLNITMPDVYIQVASQLMLEKTIEWLAKNDYSRSVWTPKVDEIAMAQQHDQAIANGQQSIHDTIKAGMKMIFTDEDLGIDGNIFIDKLTIKESDTTIPTYDVTLKEEKTVGTLQRVQNQIDSILNGTLGKSVNKEGTVGYTAQEIRNFIYAYGKERFLSKYDQDTAQKLITFLEGAEFGDYLAGVQGADIDEQGNAEFADVKTRGAQSVGTDLKVGNNVEVGVYTPNATGGTFYIDEDGLAHIDTAYINVSKKFTAKEIEIQRKSHVGGAQIISPAGATIDHVELDGDYYACYFRAVDADGRKIDNDFAVDDLVMCQTFNLIQDADGNTTNRYYWRRCMKVSNDAVEDENGNFWNIVYLSAKNPQDDKKAQYVDANSTATPAEGDSIVTVGNYSNVARQNVIIIAAYGEGSPYIYQYAGINSFALSDSKLKTRISPNGNKFTGEFIIEATGEDITDALNKQKSYLLRPSSNYILVGHTTSDSGEVTPYFSADSLTCEIYKQANGEVDKIANPTSGLMPLTDQQSNYLFLGSSLIYNSVSPSATESLTLKYIIRRYDADSEVFVDSDEQEYDGAIYPEEDMRSVTFLLYKDGKLLDKVSVPIQTDATGLDAEYRTSLELTDKSITAIAERTDAQADSIASLQLTASGLSSVVGKASHNLAPTQQVAWEFYPTGQGVIITTLPSQGNLIVELAEPDEQSYPDYTILRYKIDKDKFPVDSDFTVSAYFELTGDSDLYESLPSDMIRVGIMSIDSKTIYAPYVTTNNKNGYNYNNKRFHEWHLHTASKLPSVDLYLQISLKKVEYDVETPIESNSIFNFYNFKVEKGTIATEFTPPSQDLETRIEQTESDINLAVKVDGVTRAGMSLDADEGITLEADKVKILNNGVQSALFANGILNAALIQVAQLMTINDGKPIITISEFGDGFIRFYHSDGRTLAAKVGLDTVALSTMNSITPVDDTSSADSSKASLTTTTSSITPNFQSGEPCFIQVYDEDGNLTWVLFMDGTTNSPDKQAFSWVSRSFYYASTIDDSKANADIKLTPTEYWQFKDSRTNASDIYSAEKDNLFTKRLSDANFAAGASTYYAPNGYYFYPYTQEQVSTDGTTTKIRYYYQVKKGALGNLKSITVNS
jgi:hypothetical protein